MDALVVNIFIEFLEVAIHYLIFLSNIYPKEIFEDRKKYGAPVKYSLHPRLNAYITNCLKSAKVLLELNCLDNITFCILTVDKVELKRFVFTVFNSNNSLPDDDHYLIKLEQSLRAVFLKLANLKSFFKHLPNDCTFTILLHTNETAAVKLNKNPETEDFPYIEYQTNEIRNEREYFIHPIHTLNVEDVSIQIYGEQQEDL